LQATNVVKGAIKFPVTMRTAPSTYASAGPFLDDAGVLTSISGTVSVVTASNDGAYVSFSGTGTLTGRYCQIIAYGSSSPYIQWNAEL
jgi:hypothetical protein